MTVTILDASHLAGLHSDSKPTGGASVGIKLGALFWETDTGDTYEWDGMNWTNKVTEVTLVNPSGVDAGIIAPNKVIPIAGVDCTSIQTVWTPASGKKFRLMGGYLSASAAVSLLF
jgi:hypothetical protein